MEKLTEDQTIDALIKHLKSGGWTINSCCKGQQRGHDIDASNNGQQLLIEVKGARAGDNSPTKKRPHFDGGQIKTHFGRAIVKVLESKRTHPNATHAIAHPDDAKVKQTIDGLIPALGELGIKHFWVSSDGTVSEK